MKNPFLNLLLLCCCGALAAQPRYAAAEIPASLLKNANVVVRQYDLRFEVHNKGSATETEHKVMTLLNDKAASENDQVFQYNKIVVIEEIEGAVYDGAGKLVQEFKKKDIFDGKAPEQFVDDNRVKMLQFPRLPFPYTIEYTIVRKHKGLMFYPDFHPQTAPSESVESAKLEIIMPTDLKLRYLEINLPKDCQNQPFTWTFNQLPAFETEQFAPKTHYPLPQVLCAPTQFSLEGYKGDMSTWQSYGEFLNKLNEGKDNLPADTKTKLKALTADCPDVPCKVERIYTYLQENTRYFSIGLGIGGWQPMSAKDVDEFKYSDCKGLSNYMVTMLAAVDVPAYYTIILSKEENQGRQFPEFPNPQFNHVIACVPLPADTIWLECTSQTESCGFLSDNTDNRPALWVTPEGGKLVQTPVYDEKSNTIHRKTQLIVASDGSATLLSNDRYQGISSSIQGALAETTHADRKKAMYDLLSLSDFEIKNLDITMEKGRLPVARRNLELKVPKFAAASGKRLFVPVVALAPKVTVPVADSLREYPIQATSRSFTMEDDLTITIPEGYSLENGIEPIVYNSAFGAYELSIKNEPGQLVIHRKLLLNNSIQPKETFESFLNFFKNIAKADKTKLVLAKGT
jgi:hypothetical protein